jgi:hypothetical protein
MPRQMPQAPSPGQQPIPLPTDPGGDVPGGDLLGYILRELEQGLREGRIKPVIIGGGPVQVPMPGGGGPVPGRQGGPVRVPVPDEQVGPGPSLPQMPGGDILGQILRDLLGGARGPGAPSGMPRGPSPDLKELSDRSRQLGVVDDVGAAVFGDRLEIGRDVEQRHLDNIQQVFNRFFGTPRR